MNFPEQFFFGVSNAANQVEDGILDNWIRFGRRSGTIACYENHSMKEDRLRFWSQPEIEINLAKELGVSVFRLSLAWERLVPKCGEWDSEAAKRYREILLLIKNSGMKIMLSLFHHSLPCWMEDDEGWVNPKSKDWFVFYSMKAHQEFGDLVDYWITLNEPVPWSYLTYVEGLFPPGKKGHLLGHFRALKNMALAHNEFYQYKHTKDKTPVGMAHHMGLHMGRGLFNKIFSKLTDYLAHWHFLKSLQGHLDYFGINYYGAEWMTPKGPAQYDDIDFSDAGRAIFPEGLYLLLKKISKKYPHLPIIISENGVGDKTDSVRPAYLVQHLLAVLKSISEGVHVIGYIHWTLSDNFEWTDGYGPKFGLVEVRRDENLKRIPRESFYLYQEIIKSRSIHPDQIESTWKKYERMMGLPREYWRSNDGKHGLNKPQMRITPHCDWRFTKK